jgi:peptidoglycan/LPS O-acetylase OafA/YrhL
VVYHAVYWTQDSQPGRIADLITRTTVFGWLGVNLFFVLSGFLITGILLDSKSRQSYFGPFYTRRAQRILPAYALCLLLLGLFHMISGGGLAEALTFTANYPLIPAAHAYGPLWSLAVEEQFYLFWPLVVLLTNRRTLASICVAVIIAEPLLRGMVAMQGGLHESIHRATFLVADSLALGAFGALFFRSRFATRRNAVLLSCGLAAAACVILATGLRHGLLHRDNVTGAALQVVPFNLLFGAAIFGSIALRPALLSGRLASPVRGLGYISYGLYLYHEIAFTVYDRIFPMSSYRGHFRELLIRAIVCSSVAVGFSWLSRSQYEQIFLRRRPENAPRAPGLEAGAENAPA